MQAYTQTSFLPPSLRPPSSSPSEVSCAPCPLCRPIAASGTGTVGPASDPAGVPEKQAVCMLRLVIDLMQSLLGGVSCGFDTGALGVCFDINIEPNHSAGLCRIRRDGAGRGRQLSQTCFVLGLLPHTDYLPVRRISVHKRSLIWEHKQPLLSCLCP